MSKRVRGIARQASLFSLGMTVCLTALPFALKPSANFLGKDVSQVAAGIVGFYPWSAIAEGARVLGLALVAFFAAGCVSAAAARSMPRRRWLAFPVAPACAYALWTAGAVLKYPALYEDLLPPRLAGATFRLAFVARPSWLFGAALLLFLAPPLLAAARRPARLRAAALAAAKPLVLQTLVLLALVALLAADGPESAVLAGGARTNVLLIGVDSLRVDRLARPDVTPALRELMDDPLTVSFRDHYVGIPRTFPSWIEMLTGRYSAHTGVRHMFPGFGERSAPFAGLGTSLAAAGYATAAVSDFAGDIFPRFEAGFDVVRAPKLTLMTMIRMSIDQGLAGFLPLMTTGPCRRLFPALKESPAYADARHLGETARQYVGPRRDARPWFTTVFFSTAHFPYAAPHPYYARFADRRYRGPFRFEKNPDLGGGNGVALAPEEVAQVRALYDGAVRSIDDAIGELFADLKARGEWDQTLIVVTADHGEDLYENGLQGHGEHLRGENVLRVPLLVKLPAAAPPKVRTVDFTTRSIDLATTVLAAAGVPAVAGDGVDLMPWVRGERAAPPALPAYAETGLWFARGGHGFFQKLRLDYPGISGVLSFDQGYTGEIVLSPAYAKIVVTAKHRMLLSGDYKLIYMPTARGIVYELYDRRRDPENLHDLLAADAPHSASMRRQLLAFVKELEGPRATLLDEFVVPR